MAEPERPICVRTCARSLSYALSSVPRESVNGDLAIQVDVGDWALWLSSLLRSRPCSPAHHQVQPVADLSASSGVIQVCCRRASRPCPPRRIRRAMPAFDAPSAISVSTSRSRGDKTSSGSLRRRAITSSCTNDGSTTEAPDVTRSRVAMISATSVTRRFRSYPTDSPPVRNSIASSASTCADNRTIAVSGSSRRMTCALLRDAGKDGVEVQRNPSRLLPLKTKT